MSFSLFNLFYLFRFDSLEQNPERLAISRLLRWIVDIRPLLALRYGFPWISYTWLLFLLLATMMAFPLFKGSDSRGMDIM